MNRSAQIQWWLEHVEATRRAVSVARDERSRPRQSNLGDDRSRAARVAPLPKIAPAAHVVLRGATITGGRDEERARSLPASSSGGGGAASLTSPRSGSAASAGGLSTGGGEAAIGRARQLAAGYQPAVIKVVSYARGAARATATGQYVQREDVALETHDGRMLGDREAVAEEIKAWSVGFSKRAESQDVAAIRLKLHGVRDTPEGRETYEKAIAAGFAGHRHAFRIDAVPSGELEARLVVAMAGSQRERFRAREERVGSEEDGFNQRRLDAASESAVKARIHSATGYPTHAMSVDPGATGHGRDGVTYRLNKLVEKGSAIDERGKVIANVADARVAAREWGPSLRSQSSRDTMHLIISAKAGTDVGALTDAARTFLHDRFADHKFMFGVHTDKEADGHIHAHAVITVKNESGQKIHPGRDTFSEWREAYAQHAQAQGLKIVATSSRERASSQSYGPKDKAIVDAAERPRPTREARDRAYAADPANQRLIDNARQRIRTARTNPIRLPTSELERRTVKESVEAWTSVVREAPGNIIAKDMLERLTMAEAVGGILHTIEKRVDHLTKEDQNMPITSEQMAKDLRSMNEAVSSTTDLLDGETKQQFRETSARYLETLANRIDLQKAREQGVEELSRAEVEKIAGANADALIERAEAVRIREEREAASVRLLADRAVEAELREEAKTGVDPDSQRELRAERAIVAGSRQSAAREEREAGAATKAERVLAERPAQPLPQALIQTDALAKLRLEQENIIRELEAERPEAQSIKGQRMT
ncbi:Type IV secretory pathway, VirD2 components (Relaxase) (plasmid) [Beijerinckiaceae bacterium RH AL1]|nr:relaxase/mobilization nuclease domain-containing protein [Beijerinckiaceae bacterium]VVB50240.1 Type IV secretory pathway, VirD2 components (Relaxase) [Beijerinckiaceae bacterium RH CH11]VVB50249.1 Type IV secretory pathway, VirD2 components (Relaxase) [Beijerinckiaceae bacterium RH AL8]VVC57295.1 Type IV secretory pathway, VirD2 components (Relaxase) [Beijerinckiaceae bacterium RH AL1]